MSTITLPVEVEESRLARLQQLAQARGTTVAKLLEQQLEVLDRKERGPQKSLDEVIAEARARLAAIPEAERNVSSPQLQALIGILPPDIDARKEYRAYLERKYL